MILNDKIDYFLNKIFQYIQIIFCCGCELFSFSFCIWMDNCSIFILRLFKYLLFFEKVKIKIDKYNMISK